MLCKFVNRLAVITCIIILRHGYPILDDTLESSDEWKRGDGCGP